MGMASNAGAMAAASDIKSRAEKLLSDDKIDKAEALKAIIERCERIREEADGGWY